MITSAAIPITATTISYLDKGHRIQYSVWRDQYRGGWIWDALGTSGRAMTREGAESAARTWIKYGPQQTTKS